MMEMMITAEMTAMAMTTAVMTMTTMTVRRWRGEARDEAAAGREEVVRRGPGWDGGDRRRGRRGVGAGEAGRSRRRARRGAGSRHRPGRGRVRVACRCLGALGGDYSDRMGKRACTFRRILGTHVNSSRWDLGSKAKIQVLFHVHFETEDPGRDK